ncbi:helix-turn-helix domain-containing protein [Natronobacterium gregoryi]|uniref:MarR family transcriptional regulator n=2 Tax=Natronobacterium gregoryi TaxID=44930 RepID=L0AD34_NATGS|nr:hypothetical protein [Natronobacterium gregoryi]AFZ71751.1 Sugar-specific transcriptional regulator TrmB [Natronobacterium gregoryi SP2]ELY72863.1 hypothetical protein C490_02551 [Natronobacterium gregoryi SP2]PLK21068.1 MarR family transcriptional regulator [Natronobacterium gregoryi SP2]SFI88665.1 hypothetical protein SAMN05443661_10873 [Natronobacterium gregoryi]
MQPTAESVPERNVSIPNDLESPRAKLVYLYLAAHGDCQADRLCTDLELSKSTVLSITSTLRKRGHLERRDGQYELTH